MNSLSQNIQRYKGPENTTWTGSGSNHRFTNAANWSDGVPGRKTAVAFQGAVGQVDLTLHTVRYVASVSINGSLTLSGGGIGLVARTGTSFTLSSGSSLTIKPHAYLTVESTGAQNSVEGEITDHGGLLLNNASISSMISVSGSHAGFGGTGTFTGQSSLSITDGATFNGFYYGTDQTSFVFVDSGSVNYGGLLALTGSAACTITNSFAGSVELGGASTLTLTGDDTLAAFTASGQASALVTGGGIVNVSQLFTYGSGDTPYVMINDATTLNCTQGLTLDSGTITLEGAGTILEGGPDIVSGTLSVLDGARISAGNAIFEMATGQLALEAGSDVAAGTLLCAGGIITASGMDGAGTAAVSGSIEASSTSTTLESTAGGTLVLSGGNKDGFLTVGSGTVMLTNSVQEGALLLLGGTAEMAATACTGQTAEENYKFGSNAATLQFDANPGGLNFIDNFLHGSVIDLEAFAFSPNIIESVVNGNTLQLSLDGETASLRFGASITLSEFQFNSDGHGGTNILHASQG